MYKALDLWLPAYLRQRRHVNPMKPTHILVAVCDHFEPLHDAEKPTAMERIRRWKREFPPLIQPFRDGDRQSPRHTFFYPIEQYDEDLVRELTELCHLCGGEVEMHLHHENDTPEGFRNQLERGKEILASHELLAQDDTGAIRYGFIHGNWALNDSHPTGRHCGVPNELGILRKTGCFADFTMPSAPDPTQTRTINSIYYATDGGDRKSHDSGIPVQASSIDTPGRSLRASHLLLVQGPLGLNWERRKWRVLPRIENGELSGVNPPTPDRIRVWLRLGVHVENRPDWVFVKLHTHGGIPQNMATLLADPMRRFYEHLLGNYNDGNKFQVHFVTAREMVNIVLAAEDGKSGNPAQFRDYCYRSRLLK